MFSSLDHNNTGSLSMDELETALESLGMPGGYDEANAMAVKTDLDREQHPSFTLLSFRYVL